jgi:hypothetical protein
MVILNYFSPWEVVGRKSVLGESPRFFCGGLADIRIPQADQGI